MGSEKGRDNEKPVHEVTIVKPFYIGVYPVTQAQYQAVMGTNPYGFKGPNRPVECVSWDQAVEFCRKLSEKEGKRYRLPSEAEWEYACRAGSTAEYCFGDSEAELGDHAWFYGNSGAQTHEVGQKKPNAWGLYDMHGNDWEWCEDVWHENYEGAPADGSAWTTGGEPSLRVLRGGAWNLYPSNCRSADRDWAAPTVGDGDLGSRVVLRDI
jgi:formylglycine-generating enzyme required for sulfatase activity